MKKHIKSWVATVIIAAGFLTANSCRAQSASSADAFITSVFRLYDHGGKGVGISRKYLHSSLVTLMDADNKATGPDTVGLLDGDILCDCQEWDGIFVFKKELKMETPQRVQVLLSFAIHAPENRPKKDERSIQITLVPENGKWRIYDILSLSEPLGSQSASQSLRRELREEIDSYTHSSSRKP